MSEKTDLLLKYWEEERAQGRQSENQRATITNYIILISSLIITVIAEGDFKSDSWPLAILLIALGFFGFIITRKYYERWKYHMKEAKFIMREAQLISGIDAESLKKNARKQHEEKCGRDRIFRKIHKIHLYRLWDIFYVFILK